MRQFDGTGTPGVVFYRLIAGPLGGPVFAVSAGYRQLFENWGVN